jgi:hypothetical protein
MDLREENLQRSKHLNKVLRHKGLEVFEMLSYLILLFKKLCFLRDVNKKTNCAKLKLIAPSILNRFQP